MCKNTFFLTLYSSIVVCSLFRLRMQFGGLYCKHHEPRSDGSLRSSLIRVHSVCFHDKIALECIWIYAADVIKQTTFSGQTGLQIRGHTGIFFFLLLNQNICCGHLKEPSQWDGSFEHPKHMFKLMGKEINAILDAQANLIRTHGQNIIGKYCFKI